MAILKCSECLRRTSDEYIQCENCGRKIDESFEWIAGPRVPPTARVQAPDVSDAVIAEGEYTGVAAVDLLRAGERNMALGSMCCIGGAIVTGVTYLVAAPGGTYIVAWGAIVFGSVQITRGRHQKKLAEQAAASDQPSVFEDESKEPQVHCPHCGAPYHASDYRADAPKWLCSKCKAVVREVPPGS